MRKISIIMALSLVLVSGLAMNAMAFSIIGVSAPYAANVNGDNVAEEYGDGVAGFSLVPIPDIGLAVVADGPVFFTKTLVFDDPNDIRSNFTITWNIDNNTPFTWSDYHFIVQIDPATINTAPPPSSAQFKGLGVAPFNGITQVAFFYDPPGGKLIPPFGEPNNQLNCVFGFDTSNFNVGDQISITQIATAVPIPGALPLLGTGLVGLAMLWRRKRT